MSIASLIPDGMENHRPFEPSPQQAAIFDWVERGRGNAFVEAVAGSGKTTTLVHACKRMTGSVALCAYNKKAADDIKAKCASLGVTHVRPGTFHSFGFSAWRYVHKSVEVDERTKRQRMMDECGVPDELIGVVGQLVSLAKQNNVMIDWEPDEGYIWRDIMDHHAIMDRLDPVKDEEAQIEQVIELSQRGIEWSKRVGKTLIDFDDMIWLPLVHNTRIWQNDWVLVDEAQDTNPARRELASRMTKDGRFGTGRMLWVGDRHQAIYGFTGADNDAIDQIVDRFKCKPLPLTVTYRCPKLVVDVAHRWVNHITAHESAPDGVVRYDLTRETFFTDAELAKLDADSAILCRNTRPIVALAFALIRRGIGCHVEGRDIGQGLIKLATRWKVKSCAALRNNLEAYREREIAKVKAKAGKAGADYAIQQVNDRIDTLLIVMEGCTDIACVVAKLERMFQDTPEGGRSYNLTLSTVHKAKGREWKRVYILGHATYMPSPYATLRWQQEQESNLQYVAVTRCMEELVMLPAMED